MPANASPPPAPPTGGERNRGANAREPWLSPLVCGWVLAAAAAAVFLAGGPPQGSLGLFLVATGGPLIFCPPRVQVDWRLWIAGAGLLLCASLAFLPVRWFGLPAWRQALASQATVQLPASVTPIPWETGFWLAILALSLLIGLFLLAHPVRSQSRLWLSILASVVCAVYAGLAIYARKTGWHYPFDGGATFGFFPNRNHTATFLVTGSLLAMGSLAVVLRDGRWLLAATAGAALTLCLVGLFFFSASRGGVIFLVAGSMLWVAGLGRKHSDIRVLVSVCALAVAGGLLFLVSGSDARNRLVGAIQVEFTAPAGALPRGPQPARVNEDTPFDFRALIYRDTLHLIRDFPLTGTGLGAFRVNFAQYRQASLVETEVIHPESDWLMLAAEAGLPALICGGSLLWLLAGSLRGGATHPYWPLRWGCVVAAAAALLHGAVDVPAHRVALGWWILVVAALGLQASQPVQGKGSRVQQVLFVLGGLGALLLGGQLLRAQWFGGRALPPFAAEQAKAQILAAFRRGDAEGAMNLARAGVKVSPTAAPLYYELGVLLLRFEDTDAEAVAAFQAQRLLNPTWPDIPFLQGEAWAGIDPKRTVTLWLEALELRRRIDVARAGSTDSAPGFYGQMLSVAQQVPAVQEGLDGVADRSPLYALAWLGNVSSAVVAHRMGQITNRPELMREFTPAQRRQFLLLWDDKGGRAAMHAFLAEHSDWEAAAAPLRLRDLVRDGNFEQAVRETAAQSGISLVLPAPGTGGTPDSGVAPANGDPVAAFNAYWLAGNTVAARRALAEAAAPGASRPVLTAEYWRLRAAVAAQDQAWPQAWQDIQNFIQAKHAGAGFPLEESSFSDDIVTGCGRVIR